MPCVSRDTLDNHDAITTEEVSLYNVLYVKKRRGEDIEHGKHIALFKTQESVTPSIRKNSWGLM